MENPILELLEKLSENNQKMTQGLESFSKIDDIAISTAEKEVVWSVDKIRLLKYKRKDQPKVQIPVIVNYALVNRFYMMDLQPDRSLIRKLLELGLEIYLLDTGYPTRSDRYLTMDDHVNYYIDEAVDFVRNTHNMEKINMMGICQGGTFSTIYASLYPQKIQNLITLVTPVEFSIKEGLLFKWARYIDVDKLVDGFGGLVPGPFLDAGFQMLKPMLRVRKQKGLFDVMSDQKKLLNFLRMEKWINDQPDQAGEIYRQFIKDLYQENKLVKGELKIGAHTVDLKNINMPLLNIYAAEDHIVPPSATKPLNDYVSSEDNRLYEFPGGHIGVFTGRRSQAELSPTIAQWLEERDEIISQSNQEAIEQAPSQEQTSSEPIAASQRRTKAPQLKEELPPAEALDDNPEKEETPEIPPTQAKKSEDKAEIPASQVRKEKEEEKPKVPASQKKKEAKLDAKPKSKKEQQLDEVRERAKAFDFSNIGTATEDQKDDLKQINGIGPLSAEKLNAAGVYTFAQIAKLTDTELEALSNVIAYSLARIKSDDWVGQAKGKI